MHDMLGPHGVLLSVVAILHMEPGALLHMGTVCTSYCWPNSGTHRRSAFFPQGDERFEYVRQGTLLAELTGVFAILAFARGVMFCIENPVNSKLQLAPPIQFLMMWLQKASAALFRHNLDLGAYGASSQKPIWLYSDQEIQGIQIKLSRTDEPGTGATSSSSDRPPVMVQPLACIVTSIPIIATRYTCLHDIEWADPC